MDKETGLTTHFASSSSPVIMGWEGGVTVVKVDIILYVLRCRSPHGVNYADV